MIRAWIEKKLKVQKPLPSCLKTSEALCYLAAKGIGPLARGLFVRWRFKRCGGSFFAGKGLRVYFSRFISFGNQIVLGHDVTINGFSQNGIQIGDRVHIREYTAIQATSRLDEPGVGVVLGDDFYLGPHSFIGAGGGVKIGRGVVAGAYVQFLAENHDFSNPAIPIREQGVTRKGIEIEDDVWIGNNAIILDGVKIGRGSVIGAGAVVTRSIPPNSIAAGNPAKVIRMRNS